MEQFSKYEKMANSLKKIKLSDEDYLKIDKFKWVVTEKVHGANFSFIYKNGELKYGKRKEFLSWSDDFFGFQIVVNQIEDNIIKLFEDLSSKIEGDRYIIYGEIFGGEYPHPDIDKNINLKPIQTGVYYSQNIQFCSFDIAVEDKKGEKYYLDYETAITYFEKYNIFYAKPLFIGKFSDALSFDIKINSTIPKQFKLPELKNNLIEGVVVKTFNDKDNILNSPRVIIKIKNKQFEEKEIFHQAEKWSYIPNISSKIEELTFIVKELKLYITKNRFDSAISKIGSFDSKNKKRIDQIKNEVLKDIFTDFNEDSDNFLDQLSKDNIEWIKDRMKFEINKFLLSQKRL